MWLFLDNSFIPKAQEPMSFILPTLLNFQGSAHLLGVRSFSVYFMVDGKRLWYEVKPKAAKSGCDSFLHFNRSEYDYSTNLYSCDDKTIGAK